jgi:hypothetical protein
MASIYIILNIFTIIQEFLCGKARKECFSFSFLRPLTSRVPTSQTKTVAGLSAIFENGAPPPGGGGCVGVRRMRRGSRGDYCAEPCERVPARGSCADAPWGFGSRTCDARRATHLVATRV